MSVTGVTCEMKCCKLKICKLRNECQASYSVTNNSNRLSL